ncbi:MAG: PepSY-like domain-containing protein [Bacteroidales bacterium]|nr:PepSY-like domain-containing protein [Bacteroidales bacterium]MCF8403659.1 PepSY-like domain-containing protein [Bacteroidales bacterium]
MKYYHLLLVVLFASSVFAQNENPRDVPEAVQKSFSRKFPRAENIQWDKVGDNYKADCFYKERGTYAEFTPEGEWVITITDLDLKTLYPPVQKYLDENFKKDKVIFAEKAEKADKQNYYYVQVEQKNDETKEKYIAELFFDKTGNIDQVKLPEGVDEMTVVGIDDPNTETPAAVIDSWQKRFPKSEDIIWTKKNNPSDSIDYNYIGSFTFRDLPTVAEFLPNGKWIETRVQYKEKELYAAVVKYIEENHWNDDYIIGEKVTRADRKDYYYVKLERIEKGQFRPYVFELFFNKSGQIQKVKRPEELVSQYLLTVDVPPLVGKKFKGRFSSASDVTWERETGKWIASFTFRDLPTTAEFTDSAEWVVTVSELDIKDLYAPVQRNLDENYSDYKVIYAEKATRKDRNDHYYVELVAKKKNLTPHKLGLFFDKTGRLKEEE